MKIFILFVCSSLLTIFSSALFPKISIFFFIPFLVFVFFKKNFIQTLFWAFFCGLIVDLFSSKHFGIFSFSYVLMSFLLFSKKRFFKETPFNIAIFSSIASFVFTIIFVLLSLIFNSVVKISFLFVISDLIIMPILDGIYAFLFFTILVKFISFIERNYFSKKNI